MSDHAGKGAPSGIPRPIQEEIDKCGGLSGLVGRLPKDQELESIATIHNALSDTIRIKILWLLSIQPLCVCVIREIIGVSDSKLSYHLNILKKAGLIRGEQQGSWIIYSITGKGTTYTRSAENHSYPSYYTVAD
jgi:DNA-binding transcriptional ArsR family regulator